VTDDQTSAESATSRPFVRVEFDLTREEFGRSGAGNCSRALGTALRRIGAKRGRDIGTKQLVEFRDDGVRWQTVDTEVTIKWSYYTRMIHRDGLYLLGGKNRSLFQAVP
jgi:hypothetical protein